MADEERELRHIRCLPLKEQAKELEYYDEYASALDKKYEEKLKEEILQKFGNDEDFLKIKRLEMEIKESHKNGNDDIDITVKEMELALAKMTIYKKLRASRPKRYIKIS